MKDRNGLILGLTCIGMGVYLLYPKAKKTKTPYDGYFRIKHKIAGIFSLILGIYLIVEYFDPDTI